MSGDLLKSIRLLWSMVSARVKKSAIFLYLLVLIASAIEFFIVISIAPLVAGMTSGNSDEMDKIKSFIQMFVSSDFQNIEKGEFFLFYCISVAMLFLSASVLRLIIGIHQAKITYLASAEIAKGVFEGSLRNGFGSVLKFGEARLTSTVTVKITEIFNHIFLPCFQMLTSIILLSVIVISLLIYNAKVTVVSVAIVFIFYYLTSKISKNIVHKNGELINEKTNEIMGLVSSSYLSSRIVTIWDLANFLSSKFDTADRAIRKAKAINSIFSIGPRHILEGLSFFIVFVLTGIFYKSYGENIISLIGTFLVAAQRVMPLSQIIYASLNSIRGTRGFISDVHELYQEFANIAPKYATPEGGDFKYRGSLVISWKDFSAHNLSRDRKRQTTKINIDGYESDLIALVGNSGVGKSTLMESMMGIRQNYNGECYLMGECFSNVTDEHGQSLFPRKMIGYMPQTTPVFQGTLLENILLGEPLDNKKLIMALDVSGLSKRITWLDGGIDAMLGSNYYELSGGESKMLGIARILYRNSKVVFVDEPTSGLDSEAAFKLMTNLKKVFSQSVLIVITHDSNVIKFANKVIQIEA